MLLTGCSTVHDYCVSNAEHYSSYKECYREVRGQRLARAEAFSHIGDGLNNRQTRCTSYNGGDGYIYTTCR